MIPTSLPELPKPSTTLGQCPTHIYVSLPDLVQQTTSSTQNNIIINLMSPIMLWLSCCHKLLACYSQVTRMLLCMKNFSLNFLETSLKLPFYVVPTWASKINSKTAFLNSLKELLFIPSYKYFILSYIMYKKFF